MDTSATYREIIKQVILQFAKLHPSHGDIRLDTVFDEIGDRYALMQVGWDRGRRVRGNLIYITLQDGKVYIEYDGMECGITQNLIDQGIPENDIVLAFLLDSLMALTAAV
nr:XisI protein [Tychonema sp. BBK16]MCF6374130.1 XisI protein [Tychonema sp. BBK16]